MSAVKKKILKIEIGKYLRITAANYQLMSVQRKFIQSVLLRRDYRFAMHVFNRKYRRNKESFIAN